MIIIPMNLKMKNKTFRLNLDQRLWLQDVLEDYPVTLGMKSVINEVLERGEYDEYQKSLLLVLRTEIKERRIEKIRF